MCTILLNELMTGKSYPDAGSALYNALIENIQNSDKITIDMQDVPALPSVFLNTSFGRFIKEKGKDALKDRISFSKITASQAERIKEYLASFS